MGSCRFAGEKPPRNGKAEVELELEGDFTLLNNPVCDFLEKYVTVCQPARLHLCDGSGEENHCMCEMMRESGMIRPLTSSEFCNW